MIDFLLGGVRVGALLYLVLAALLFLAQRKLMFRPDRTASVPPLPDVQVVTVRTEDGLDLPAWYLPAMSAAPTVLYLHGNAGNIGGRADRLRAFAARGWGVMMPEYRGFGTAPGSPSEAGLVRDVAAAYRWLRARVDAGHIIIWGESLGTGLATRLAAGQGCAAVVLEAPYTSLLDIARQQYWFVPVRLLLRDRFDSLRHAPMIVAPVLVLHGGKDDIVPPAMGQAIFGAILAPKQFFLAPGAGQMEVLDHGGAAALTDFVSRHVPT